MSWTSSFSGVSRKGTPEEVINIFTEALEKVVANEDYQKEMEGYMVEPVYLNPEEANELMEQRRKILHRIESEISHLAACQVYRQLF